MSMLSVAFDSVTEKLSVVDEETKLGAGVYPTMYYVTAGSYEPGKPWSILNGGMALSRQLGWDDPTALHGNGITPTGQLVIDIANRYGADAGIWIELISQSPGLEAYFADGMWGVGGTGNAASGTPQVYTDANGFPIIYVDNYYGILGTNGSSNRWRWDGSMIHNVYAVPAAFLTQPNQLFSATYRVYIGDSAGNDLAPAAATIESWTWKGPATVPDNVPDQFSFTSQTGVVLNTTVESGAITVGGIAVPSLISISGGEYSVSTDGGTNWSAYSGNAPATVANGNQVKVRQTSSASYSTTTSAVLTIGGVSGSFDITTMAQPQVTVPNVVGKTQASAQAAITIAGLTVGVVTQAYSATVPKGSVISQSPAAGTSVLPATAVNLVVSKGKQSYRITGAGFIFPERTIFPALFSLNVSTANLKVGQLAFNYLRKKLNLVSTYVASINESNNVYTISGSGKMNGAKGYTFTATIVIGKPDMFGIVIKKASGSVVFSTAPKSVMRGDINLFR
jgi:hypothetical protein